MNFIEQFFGFSPDAGSGLTEMAFLLVPIVIMLAAAVRQRTRLRAKRI
ncbi:MAG TPA: hypothetical protein VJW20_03710 [Candidatus Angelobacter sp.]|nr:hypothetical protein [Candidatus Angelobacter sp.]